LKIIFAGTPNFALTALLRLHQSPHDVVAVYTQPDRQKGRGLHLVPSPVKEFALNVGIPVCQPISLKDKEEQQRLADWNADAMVVAAYGMLLPEAVLSIPRYGCINIHPSLLPKFRGAAPIQRTIFFGETQSGVTIMQMDVGLDTGPILLQKKYQLDANETSQTLQDTMAEMGADCLMETLTLLEKNQLTPKPQDFHLATYAHKITKEEAKINWNEKALTLEHKIRAFNPWPVAYCEWQGKNLRIWEGKAINLSHHLPPGRVMKASENSLDITTQDHVLRLSKIQLPGGKIISSTDFYHGYAHLLKEGELFL
jgi:methionyl-tRNA formyltransferase